MVQFGLQTDHLPGLVRALVCLTALLLPLPLMVVQAVAMALAMQLNVLVLGLRGMAMYRQYISQGVDNGITEIYILPRHTTPITVW